MLIFKTGIRTALNARSGSGIRIAENVGSISEIRINTKADPKKLVRRWGVIVNIEKDLKTYLYRYFKDTDLKDGHVGCGGHF